MFKFYISSMISRLKFLISSFAWRYLIKLIELHSLALLIFSESLLGSVRLRRLVAWFTFLGRKFFFMLWLAQVYLVLLSWDQQSQHSVLHVQLSSLVVFICTFRTLSRYWELTPLPLLYHGLIASLSFQPWVLLTSLLMVCPCPP